MPLVLATLLTVLGMVVGFWLPDLDLRVNLFGLLLHRSILTHGCLLPLFACWWITRKGLLQLQLLVVGFCAAMAAHLCFDLFPSRWYGFALITIPLFGRTTPTFSWLWIAGSIVVCLYLVLRWVADLRDLGIVAASMIGAFAIAVEGQVYARLLPLVVFMAAAVLAALLASSSNPYLQQLRHRIAPRTT